jgi:hypothetical protein
MSSKGWNTDDSSDPVVLPEWAVQKARTSLQLGMKVPEVEQQLIAGGLDRAVAAALVIKVRDGSLSLGEGGSQGISFVPTKGWDTSDPTDLTALPAWAVEKARASLRVGVSVPEVEQRLVAGGLSSEAAEAAVNRVLEAHVRAEVVPQEQERRLQPLHRILSAVLGVCLLFAYLFSGSLLPLKVGAFVVLPVGCIWFGRGLIRSMGWFVLAFSAGYVVMLYLL